MAQSHVLRNQVLLAFACVYVFWGSTYGAIHIAALDLSPPLVGALRCVLSTAVLAAICLARKTSLRVSLREAWRLALVGVLFMSVNNVLLIWAETKVDSGYASLVIAMTPIVVAVAETILPDGDRLNRRGWFGTLLGAVGIFALLWPSLRREGAVPTARETGTLFGFAILVVAALAFAAGSVMSRRFRLTTDSFVATTWQIGAAGVLNLGVAFGTGSLHTAVWTRTGLLAIAYLSVFGTVVGLTAYTYLLKHVPVTKVATYAFVNPIIAVLLGVFVLHERLAAAEIFGSVIILAGVATVILSREAV